MLLGFTRKHRINGQVDKIYLVSLAYNKSTHLSARPHLIGEACCILQQIPSKCVFIHVRNQVYTTAPPCTCIFIDVKNAT